MKTIKRSLMAMVLLAFILGGKLASAQENDTVRYDAYGRIVKTRTPVNTEYWSGFLTFESKNQDMRTWFDLRVNFDGAHYFDKNTMNALGDGLTIRRLRFAM